MKKLHKYNKSFEDIKNNICDTTYGLCPAPLSAEAALDILVNYLLGDNWCVVLSMNKEQTNAAAVEQILDKYSKQWKKDWKYFQKYKY